MLYWWHFVCEVTMQSFKKIVSNFTLKRLFWLVLGTAILSFGIHNIHQRTAITEGGIIGLVLLINHWLGVPASIASPLLDAASFPYAVYSEIKPNPTIQNVQDGVAAFKAAEADCIVTIGGGSSMDTAKAIGIIINNPEFADVRSLEGLSLIHI